MPSLRKRAEEDHGGPHMPQMQHPLQDKEEARGRRRGGGVGAQDTRRNAEGSGGEGRDPESLHSASSAGLISY